MPFHSRVCTASGTGFKVNESLAVGGNRTQTAQAAWVGYPSSCTWTATGAGGSTTYTEVVTTAPAPTTKPTINVAHDQCEFAIARVCTASGTDYMVNESVAVNGSRTRYRIGCMAGLSVELHLGSEQSRRHEYLCRDYDDDGAGQQWCNLHDTHMNDVAESKIATVEQIVKDWE